jgi:O-antigen ligase
VISKLRLLERYLNLLLFFLFPTQLAIHFWPSFAFIFGLRVDYLSPTIYLTDILFICLFAAWCIRARSKVWRDIKKAKYFFLFFLLAAFLNTFVSVSPWVSVLRWTKIAEFIVLGYYVKSRQDIFKIREITRVLFYSLIFFSLVGILQFLRGQTFGGALYILGERAFSISTPGIALANLFGRNLLRAYSTFPHPNSLAGFFGAGVIFLVFNKVEEKRFFRVGGFIAISAAFILTFSLSAFVGLVGCFAFYLFFRKNLFDKKLFYFSVVLTLLLSLYLTVFSGPLLQLSTNLSQSTSQRLELGLAAGDIFSQNWIVGTGLNTFIIREASFGISEHGIWLLQPVHNIFLLVFAETGILGAALLVFFFASLFERLARSKNQWGVLLLIFVLVSGLLDHYWLTIQQNMLLLSFFFGISFREKI